MSQPGHPLAAARRLAVVTAITAGAPPTVTIQIGGDTTTTANVPYDESYQPVVNDTVVTVSVEGDHYVIGRANLGNGPIGSLIVRAIRTDSSGTITTEAMLGGTPNALNQVAFTVAEQRRVVYKFKVLVDTPSAAAVNVSANIRRNATGAAVLTSDTRIDLARGHMSNTPAVQGVTLSLVSSEVLAAGTYAYGIGVSCSGGSGVATAGATFPNFVEVWDGGRV